MSRNKHRYSRRSMDILDPKNPYNLSKIIEDPKEIEEEEPCNKNSSALKFTPKSRSTLPPILTQADKKDKYIYDFMIKLIKYPHVYHYLTQEGKSRSILQKKTTNTPFLTPRKSKLPSLLQTPTNAAQHDTSFNTSVAQEEAPPTRPLTIEIKQVDTIKRQNSKESISASTLVNQKSLNFKMPVLEKNSNKLFEKFKIIAGGTDSNLKDYKLTYDSYKEFLNRRYPPEMSEIMIKWLYHGLSVNFDGWLQDMQKFLNFSQERLARMAFELYDFNKDRYICTADAFRIISIPNSIIFDQDIIKIRQAFLQKTSQELNSARLNSRKKKKQKNKAFMSAEDEVKYKVPPIHPTKPEALTLEDFLRIQFSLNKPQIIFDLVKYLIGIDLIEFNTEVTKTVKRKKSEELIEEMLLNNEIREKMICDSRWGYYRELENAMNLISLQQWKAALGKFGEMNIDGPSKLKEINLKSIFKVFSRYFGSENEYILTSFHKILSGPKNLNITKISFLNNLSPLFSDETSNSFAFGLYDQNQDGLITCEEINRLFETLPENSLIYKECLILINEFIASIFGKRHKPLEGIDYSMFRELIPRSILIEEFVKSFFYTDSQIRRNLAFCDKSELTSSELEAVKKYSHLARNIELGELSRKSEDE